MSQTHQLSACPGCSEPLEPGDRYCGACGYDLSVVPEPPQDQPAVAPGASAAPGVPPAPVPEVAPEVAPAPAPEAAPPAAPPPAAAPAPGPRPPRDEALPPAPAPPAPERPAAPRGGSPGAPDGAPDGGPDRGHVGVPAAPPADPHGGPPAAGPVSPPGGGDFELAAPDPHAAGAAPCVACRTGRVSAEGYCENCGHKQPHARDHVERELGPVAAVTDRGLRHHRNEDAFAVTTAVLPDGSPAVVAIVCDGVSSASRPDDASAAAAATAEVSLRGALASGTPPQQAMHEAIVAAAEAVEALADEPSGDGREQDGHRHRNAPACTLVGAVAAGDLLVVGWVGDSRVYWVPDDRSVPAARLTEDDSWAAQMVAAGLMDEQEAYADERAHAITGWLGADAYEVEPHTAAFRPDRPGVVVVCTDGLWNYAEGAQDMARVVPGDAADRPLHCARVLVGHALDGGGHDNVTVAVVPFAVERQGAGSA
ncbi:PP2C family serine/threonine-protein phosphatase [Streptomyces sp. DH12]|uniref:PP2C family protein-serine/threonine phosphatase n=1 Tax=Streptomyces sp. DH12 TaxID=2857010 RepID=UPI001E558349|nr:PP2C family serine/threonine-protein phosphatase [Streptomyces sp. DH12]